MAEDRPSSAVGIADSLLAHARRHAPRLSEDSAITDLLTAIDPQPFVPHEVMLIAGTVMAVAFRHDRSLSEPAPADLDEFPTADRSF
jgi:type III secretion system FlhB-like substrate exporter